MIRWITHKTKWGYHALWFDERYNTWHEGGFWCGKTRNVWPGGEPYPAPDPASVPRWLTRGMA